MDTISPAPMPPAANVLLRGGDDEEVPLGWECANPALQIECWSAEDAAASAAGLVSTS